MLKIQQRHVMKQQTLANTNKPPAPPPPLIPSGTPTKQDSSTMNGMCDCFILPLSSLRLKDNTTVQLYTLVTFAHWWVNNKMSWFGYISRDFESEILSEYMYLMEYCKVCNVLYIKQSFN